MAAAAAAAVEAAEPLPPLAPVAEASDPRVAEYRLFKLRDHTLVSQLHAEALRRGEHRVVALGSKIVARGLHPEALYPVASLFAAPALSAALAAAATAKSRFHPASPAPLLLEAASPALFNETLGIGQNAEQCAAAIFDLAPRAPEALVAAVEAGAEMQERLFPLLVLDDVRSADNIGAILRTAFSLGVKSVFCSPTSLSALNSRSARVSMGALFHMHVFAAKPHSQFVCALEKLAAAGVDVVGTSPEGPELISAAVPTPLWALLVGNEKVGAAAASLRACARVVRLKQLRGDSLSVVAAASIALYLLGAAAASDGNT